MTVKTIVPTTHPPRKRGRSSRSRHHVYAPISTKKAMLTGPLASTARPSAAAAARRQRGLPTSDSQNQISVADRQSTNSGSVSIIRPTPTTSSELASTSGAMSAVPAARRRRANHAARPIVAHVASTLGSRAPNSPPNSIIAGLAAQ